MKIMHAVWVPYGANEGIHFWAENADLFQAHHQHQGSFHPFSSPQLEVLSFLQNLTNRQEQWRLDSVTLTLPSHEGGPLPSTDLFFEYGDEEGRPVPKQANMTHEWGVRTVVLSPLMVWRYFLSFTQQSLPGLTWAASVTYWTVVIEFVLELLSRESFLPHVRKNMDKAHEIEAVWMPYLSFDDHRRMIMLAEAMPPVCLSLSGLKEKKLDSAQKLLLHVVQVLMDHFIRTEVTHDAPLLYRNAAFKRNTPIYEAWFKALFMQKCQVRATAKEADPFIHQMQQWLMPLHIDYHVPFRICFRLLPVDHVEGEEEKWALSYYLQSNKDFSLTLSSQELQKNRAKAEDMFGLDGQTLLEMIEQNIKKAAQHFAVIQDFLNKDEVSAVWINTEHAYYFLRHVVPILEDCGFGVLLPAWWKKPLRKLGVRLQVAPVLNEGKVQKFMGLETIVKYDWQVALGDEILTPEEFQHLTNLKMPLVRVRGEWIELKIDEIEKAIAFFKKRAEQSMMTLGEVMNLALEEEVSECGLPVVGVDYEPTTANMFQALMDPTSLIHVETPEAFQGTLRPYQKMGLSWLSFLQKIGLGGCLADDMGLGKTIQLIALFLYERQFDELGKGIGPTLIMCPMSIMSNWKNEMNRFAPQLKVMIHHGVNRLNKEQFVQEARNHDVVITTYALVAPELDKLMEVEWHRIVLDEAQNIKNIHTKQTQAIKFLKGRYRMALTGTPLENRLLELWSIMDFINPGYLGSSKTFRQRYAIPIERFNDTEKSQRLKRLIRPFVLRRVKTDLSVIKDLPQKIETKEMCFLTKEQVSLYETVVKQMLQTIDTYEGIQRRGIILSVLMQLKQICNHPVQYLKDEGVLQGRSGKMARLYELLEEVTAEGDKALIFTQFSQMGHLLKKDLQDTLKQEVLFLHGMSTKTQRDEMIERFQDPNSDVKLFVLSLKAGGLGLNLTSANHVFHFDRWWNPAIENQATDRAFRIGQKKTVHVHKFVCKGTVEERIDEMIDRKRELTDLVVEQGEQWITELCTDDLKELFQLNMKDV